MTASSSISGYRSIDQDSISKGRALFNGKGTCFNCHGKDGDISTVLPNLMSMLNPKPTDLRNRNALRFDSDNARYKVLKDGIPGTAMVARIGRGMTEDEAWAIIAYLNLLNGSVQTSAETGEHIPNTTSRELPPTSSQSPNPSSMPAVYQNIFTANEVDHLLLVPDTSSGQVGLRSCITQYQSIGTNDFDRCMRTVPGFKRIVRVHLTGREALLEPLGCSAIKADKINHKNNKKTYFILGMCDHEKLTQILKVNNQMLEMSPSPY